MLGIEEDIKNHLYKLPVNDAKEACITQDNDKYWSSYLYIDSKEGNDPKFNLSRAKNTMQLRNLGSPEIIEEDKFCILAPVRRNIVGSGCM